MKGFSLFSGIGAFEKSFSRMGIDCEMVGYCEIDKYASTAYSAIHDIPEVKNYGDIMKVKEKELPDFDFMSYGFPCQDISVAGKGKGIVEGQTRSGLLYEALRIARYKNPKIMIAENVKNLIGKNHKADFQSLLLELNAQGYNNYWQVLNSKNYGIPQNRERVFIISIRKDIDDLTFSFPIPFDNGLRLVDMLEDEVEEKYFISDEKVQSMLNSTYNDRAKRILDPNKVCTTLCARDFHEPKCVPVLTPDRAKKRQNGRRFKTDGEPMFTLTGQDRHGVMVKEATQKGYAVAHEGDSINLTAPNSKTRRGRVGKGIANTLDTQCNQGILQVGNIHKRANRANPNAGRVYATEGISPSLTAMGGGDRQSFVLNDYRIRKLTPLECWRLQGFDDSDYWTARKALEKTYYNGKDRSNSQMYKMAGNSITVDVLDGINKSLFKEGEE